MNRRVYITGIGPISGLGIGIEPTWEAVRAQRSAIARITAFDAAQFDCRIAAQVPEYKITRLVPKTYRKATKVMARDVELAVIAADLAARDAGLVTKGTDPDTAKAGNLRPSHDPTRVGCHIGAGLIAAELDELTAALARATAPPAPATPIAPTATAAYTAPTGARSDANADQADERNQHHTPTGPFSIHKWGEEGMSYLTPLWLLKYLPNMLACHVTIIHDTQGPSNTITCGGASGGLSIGESLRVIQRGAADLCFCGGAESKLNPMAYLRQQLAGRLASWGDPEGDPTRALRPFDEHAAGTVLGEGGGIVTLEAAQAFEKRAAADARPDGGRAEPRPYAEVAGFGASQSVHRATRNLGADPTGRGPAAAIRAAMREADAAPDDIDLIVPFGSGVPAYDRAELTALRNVFGDALPDKHLAPLKALGGNCGAGAGGLEVAIAAKALAEQVVPSIPDPETPLEGLAPRGDRPSNPASPPTTSAPAELRCALVYSTAYSGQNTALVLRRVSHGGGE